MAKRYSDGDQVNNWTIIEFNKEKKRYRCICKCGKEGFVTSSHLFQGAKSCADCSYAARTTHSIARNHEGIRKSLYRNYREGAERRKHSFSISFEFFNATISKPCFYCGLESSNRRKYGSKDGKQDFLYNGLDRYDNTLGYREDNCVPCCKHCNKAKMEMTFEEFKEWIFRLYHKVCM